MSRVQIFSNPEFGQVRIVQIEGVSWFVGTDVAAALGYSQPHKAVSRHVEEDDGTFHTVMDNKGRPQQTRLINESGVYDLILSSKLPAAKKFKRWITSEVLPSIRKTGSYNLPELTKGEFLLKMAQSNLELERRMEQNEWMTEKHEMQIAENSTRLAVLEALTPEVVEPDPEYYLTAINNNVSKNVYTISGIAKAFGMSGVMLNKFLHAQGIIYPAENGWRVNKEKCEEGYVRHSYGKYRQQDGKIKIVLYTLWTHWGMSFIVTYLKNLGFVMSCSIKPYDRHAAEKRRRAKNRR